MRKLSHVLAVAAAVLLGVLTDAPFQQGVAHASHLPQPANWVPASANMVIYVDWSALLASPPVFGLEHALAEQQESWSQLQEFRELTGMDLWRDVWAFSLFTSVSENETSSWALAVYGAFDPERVVETMETKRRVERSEYQETTLHSVRAVGEQPQALAFPDSTTALFGQASEVRAMLDTGFGFAPSAADGELERWMNELSMAETFWVVGTGGADLPTRRVENALSSSLPPLQSFAISARFGSKVKFKAQGDTSSSEQARKLADVVRGMKALTGFQHQPDEMIQAIAETLEIETLDETVEVSFEIEGKAIRDLLRHKTRNERSAFVKP